jgi:hypothetical protein
MNEILTYILGQIMTIAGFIITAWVFGRSFAKGVSTELKEAVPLWIHKYISETREVKAIAKAKEEMQSYRI